MEKEKCKFCGKVLKKDDRREFEGDVMCEDCFCSQTSVCEHCGVRLWNDDNHGTDGYALCQRCYDNHYTNCERCGCLISYDSAVYFDGDDYPYCSECYNRIADETVIHSYIND